MRYQMESVVTKCYVKLEFEQNLQKKKELFAHFPTIIEHILKHEFK